MKPAAGIDRLLQQKMIELRSEDRDTAAFAHVLHDGVAILVGQEGTGHARVHDGADVERQQLDRLVRQAATAHLVARERRFVDDDNVEPGARQQVAEERPGWPRANDQDIRGGCDARHRSATVRNQRGRLDIASSQVLQPEPIPYGTWCSTDSTGPINPFSINPATAIRISGLTS